MKPLTFTRVALAGAALSVFAFAPLGFGERTTGLFGTLTVQAQEHGGQGGQGGQGQGGQGQGGQGQGQGGQGQGQGGPGGSGHVDDGTHVEGGHTGGAGGQGVDHVSGKDLGRLNMARAFLAPGFTPEESEEPMMQIAAYMDAVAAGDWDDAVAALGMAASIPITSTTVVKLDQLLKLTLPAGWSSSALAAAAEAIRQQQDHEHETH